LDIIKKDFIRFSAEGEQVNLPRLEIHPSVTHGDLLAHAQDVENASGQGGQRDHERLGLGNRNL
jgi:hypothetical protein